MNICCTAGQYSYFPGCTPKVTRSILRSHNYRFSQFILHIGRYRVYGGCGATNRLMHGWYSRVQDIPSTVYYTALGVHRNVPHSLLLQGFMIVRINLVSFSALLHRSGERRRREMAKAVKTKERIVSD